MEALFVKLVNLSVAAGWLVLAVIILRLIFRKAPKWLFCALWGLVAVRLMLPVSFESRFSLIPSAALLPPDIVSTAHPQIHSGITPLDNLINRLLSTSINNSSVNNGSVYDTSMSTGFGNNIPVNDSGSQKVRQNGGTADNANGYDSQGNANDAASTGSYSSDSNGSANPTRIVSFLLSRLWVSGLIGMLVYAVISSVLLRRKVMTAVRREDNIYEYEGITSPFVMGSFRPAIYIPCNISDEDRGYVIAHERAHIGRFDHIWKPLGFILLAVYWFNPLMWAAYVLLCRDIEGACDERVVSGMQTEERKAYSMALLNVSTGIKHRTAVACPLAFGETGVKSRIKNVMNYKKPVFWIVAAAVVGCVVLAVCFLTNPVKDRANGADTQPDEAEQIPGTDTGIERSEGMFSDNMYDALRENWNRWDEMDTFSRMLSSSTPGHCHTRFETWKDAVEFMGIEPINPLEDADWLEIRNYTGADIRDIFDENMLPHCSVVWGGTKDDKLTYAAITSGYADGDIRVTLEINLYQAYPPNVQEIQDDPVEESSSLAGRVSGITLSETYHERAVAKQAEFSFRTREGYGFSYTLRCVNLETGEGAMDKPNAVMNRIMEYMGLGGIPTTGPEMMVPVEDFNGIQPTGTEQIPGTDSNSETDYYITTGDDPEELEIEWKNDNQ
ncbi:MAG: M56 family metallopeptidase [Lachnospiraceae bacterium]|nr:M56 family metallopeptidase [Lachnospiraceae bacterium]